MGKKLWIHDILLFFFPRLPSLVEPYKGMSEIL